MDKAATGLSLAEMPRDFGFCMDGANVAPGGCAPFVRASSGHRVAIARTQTCTPGDLVAAVTSARRAFHDRRGPGLSGAEYGLAASVRTLDIDKALTVTKRIQAGRFRVKTTLSGGPELPVGGSKQSGRGREAGMMGVEGYSPVKSVHIAIDKRDRRVG